MYHTQSDDFIGLRVLISRQLNAQCALSKLPNKISNTVVYSGQVLVICDEKLYGRLITEL